MTKTKQKANKNELFCVKKVAKNEQVYLRVFLDWMPMLERLNRSDLGRILLGLMDIQGGGDGLEYFNEIQREKSVYAASFLSQQVRKSVINAENGAAGGRRSMTSALRNEDGRFARSDAWQEASEDKKEEKRNNKEERVNMREEIKAETSAPTEITDKRIKGEDFNEEDFAKALREKGVADGYADHVLERLRQYSIPEKAYLTTALRWWESDRNKPTWSTSSSSDKSYDSDDFFQAALARSLELGRNEKPAF